MQRRTLIRARDLAAFRDALVTRALDGPPLLARRRLVILPTRASAELFRQTLEARALGAPGRAVVLPDLVTRDDWLGRLLTALPDARPLLSRLARERLLLSAARASAGRRSVGRSPFDLRPGLVAAMLDLYDELKRRQRTVTRFARTLLAALDTVKGMDRGSESLMHQTQFLAFAFLGYERRVEASSGWDEHVLRRELLARQPAVPFDQVVVAVADHPADPKGLWPADFDLLGRLRGVTRLEVVTSEEAHDAGFRDRVETELPGIEEVRHDVPVAKPGLVRSHSDAESLCWVSRDREEELRDVARLVRARARPGPAGPELHELTAVVFRRPLPYLYLAQQVFADAGVPYQAFDALPLAAEPYAALVDLAIAVARTGGTREAVVALLRSSLLRFVDEAGEPIGHEDASALDAALADRRATGEADTYVAEVDAYFDDPDTRRKAGRARARRAARAAAAIREALHPYRTGTTATRVRTIAAFLRRHERTLEEDAPARDRHLRARAAVLGILDGLADACATDEANDGGDDPTSWIRHAIEAQTFAPRRGVAGVHLVDAAAARFGEFDHVHLVGLVETDWPERPPRTIFYTSGLLEPLGWTAGPAHARAELAAFRDLAGLARRTTTLHAFTLEGDAIVARSPVVDLARDLPAAVEPVVPVGLVFADEILPLGGASPGGTAGTSETSDGLDATTRAWLDLRRARPPAGDPRNRGCVDPQPPQAYRVTGVERYAICPFKYFAESVLGLPEERDESEALTPLERGAFLHQLLEEFYRAWQAGPGGAITLETLPDALALFEGLARGALSRLSPGDRALEEARLLGSIVTPGLAEKVFDVEIDGPADLADRLVEVSLDGTYVFPQLGGFKRREIAIRAKADRIDVFADGSLRVIDYKSGRAPDAETTVQVPVYAHAARLLLEARDRRPHPIRAALYLAFGEDKDIRSAVRGGEDAEAAVAGRVSRFADLVTRIEEGRFPARPVSVNKCTFCGVAGVCRKEYWTEADEPAEPV